MVLTLIVVAMVVFLTWHSRKCDESLAALNAECDTGTAFIEWRLRNQGVYIGLSEEGRMLLGRWLEASDWFLRTHKFIDDREKREWLVKMFYDLPPKYPDSIPSGDKGVRNDALSLFIQM
jgi:hypothetical protein